VPQTHGCRLRRLFTHGSRRLGTLLTARFFNFLWNWPHFPISFILRIEIARWPTVARSILAIALIPTFVAWTLGASATFAAATTPASAASFATRFAIPAWLTLFARR
jgi:hypothetical protein